MPILGVADYPAIRAAIDLGLTQAELPDAVIEMPQHRPLAEARIVERDPEAESRQGLAGQRIRAAAILLTAAAIAPSVRQYVSKQVEGQGYRLAERDYDKHAAHLRGLAWREVSAARGDGVDDPPFVFAVAPGVRAR